MEGDQVLAHYAGPSAAQRGATHPTCDDRPACKLMQAVNPQHDLAWFVPGTAHSQLTMAGMKPGGGGVHQSKTMMLRELAAYLHAVRANEAPPEALVLTDNVLGKATGSARRLALARLRALYGVGSEKPVTRALHELWERDPPGQPLLALLCALARDPLLRNSADVVLPAPIGMPVRWPLIADGFEARYPGRFSDKMRKSLSQNCASSWTQSGHLQGKVKKLRRRAKATGAAAAYAALLATIAGFGGPALLASPWLEVLDCPADERLSLLRRAEAQGLARIRAVGDTIEISVRRPMAQTLGITHLGGV